MGKKAKKDGDKKSGESGANDGDDKVPRLAMIAHTNTVFVLNGFLQEAQVSGATAYHLFPHRLLCSTSSLSIDG